MRVSTTVYRSNRWLAWWGWGHTDLLSTPPEPAAPVQRLQRDPAVLPLLHCQEQQADIREQSLRAKVRLAEDIAIISSCSMPFFKKTSPQCIGLNTKITKDLEFNGH